VHHGGRGQSFVYELLYDGKGADGRPFLMRLLDVAELGHEYDGKNEHREADPEHLKPGNEPSSSPQRASVEHATRAAKEEENCCEDNDFEEVEPDAPRNAHQGPVPTQPSYPQSNRSVVGCQLSVLGPDHPPSNPLPASLPTTSNQQPTTNE
jgi:hypothetical protein